MTGVTLWPYPGHASASPTKSIEKLSSAQPLSKKQKIQRDQLINQLSRDPSTLLILDQYRSLMQLQSLAALGPRTGGGGNKCSLAIQQITRRLVDSIDQSGNILNEEEKQALLKSIANATFLVRPKLVLNGETKDAINYPFEKVILISDHFCESISNAFSLGDVTTLFHEYLGLAQIEDRAGQISGIFWEQFSINSPLQQSQRTEAEHFKTDMQIELMKLHTKINALIQTEYLRYVEAICRISNEEMKVILRLGAATPTSKILALSDLSNECLLLRTADVKSQLSR